VSIGISACERIASCHHQRVRKLIVAAVVLQAAVLAAMWQHAAHADAPKLPIYSVWTGSYVCAQGLTAAKLTLETGRKGDVTAKFEFGPHPQNKGVPHGSFWLKGHAELGVHGEMQVKIVPDAWIVRPANYVMVGADMTSDAEQTKLAGKIDFTGCTTIDLQRVQAERAQ
jgi:hypothetical protein